MEPRSTHEILKEIKILVNSTGYIYTLCMILIEDFHFTINKLDKLDHFTRLNKNEILLLFGFLIQNPLNLKQPNDPFDLIKLKAKTHELMGDLHKATLSPMIDKFKDLLENQLHNPPKKEDFFGGEGSFIEPIFYSGSGLYDFQFLEFLPKKYRYDKQYLASKHSFHFDQIILIAEEIKSIHQEKIKQLNLLDIKDNKRSLTKQFKKFKRKKGKEKSANIEDLFSIMEFYQYHELFETKKHISESDTGDDISQKGWNSFYDGLLDLFIVSPSDFRKELSPNLFFEKFSIDDFGNSTNSQFQDIGDYNLLSSKPILKISDSSFFLPSVFSLYEAIYESPYYWMADDDTYKNQLGENRGKVGEDIAYEILGRVFGETQVHKSVKIVEKLGKDITDIDVLCTYGTKALVVQVKSKKLTQLSRKGDFTRLKTDFKAAVQDAYQQGLVSRQKILEKGVKFYLENGSEIKLEGKIDEVYILVVTVENYPTLNHQSRILIQKDFGNPFPLVMTIFDLELVAHYLERPFDFLYYIRQRIHLIEYFISDEEFNFLGYHLLHKLYKNPNYSSIQIDSEFGQIIDADYYPFKLGIPLPEGGSKIENRWYNPLFEKLCIEIDEFDSPETIDVIFNLLDWSSDTRENLIKHVTSLKKQTRTDNEWHNFSLTTAYNKSNVGITFISWPNNNIMELKERLETLCLARKYKSKANIWVGLGCLKDSVKYADTLFYHDSEWQFDEPMEEVVKHMFEGKNQGKQLVYSKKIGRNSFCPCGSGIKYKKCCGA